MNTVIAADTCSRGDRLLADDHERHRTRTDEALLLPRAGRNAGVQGRLTGGGATAGAGADPVPALASVRARHRLERASRTAITALRGRLHDRQARPVARCRTRRPACGRSRSMHGATSDAAERAVHADGVDPRCERVAESGHHRVREDRRAGRPQVHDDQPVRRVHGPRGRHRRWGARCRATPTIANLAQQQYAVTVPAGSTSLRATIGSPSDPGADLDLFVFNCTTGTVCSPGSRADGDSEESVTIANPAAGHVGRPRRRVRRARGHDDVQVHRRVLRDAVVRVGLGHGRERTASGRVVLDGSGLGDGERGAGRRSGALRQRRGADRRERPRRPGRGRRLERHARSGTGNVERPPHSRRPLHAYGSMQSGASRWNVARLPRAPIACTTTESQRPTPIR